MTTSVLIAGAGLGGVRAAQTLRRLGHRGPVTLLGAEAHPPYDRPPLSKAGLTGERGPVWLATREALTAQDVDLRTGVELTSLSLPSKEVRGADGTRWSYDKLIIATGAEPRRLPGALVLRTLDDAIALRDRLRPGVRLVVIGGGFLGCAVAATARGLGARVTLVEADPLPLGRVLGSELGARLAAVHRDQGVDLRCGVGVSSIAGSGVTLTDGGSVEADVVVAAIGVTPRTGWLAGSGLTLDDGVVCDESLSAAGDVWAVGDLCRWTGGRLEHWTNAGAQAEHVAARITGQPPAPFTAVPWFWSDQYHLKITCWGRPAGGDDVQVTELGGTGKLKAIFSRGGVVSAVAGFSAGGAVLKLRGALGKPLAAI